jgi:hypothetical protein
MLPNREGAGGPRCIVTNIEAPLDTNKMHRRDVSSRGGMVEILMKSF